MLSVSILSIGAVSKNQSTSNRFTIFHYYFLVVECGCLLKVQFASQNL